jgi:hypothetical protein
MANLLEYNSRFIPVSTEETDDIFNGEGGAGGKERQTEKEMETTTFRSSSLQADVSVHSVFFVSC